MCSCGKGLVTAAGNSLLVVMVVVIVAMWEATVALLLGSWSSAII